MTLVATTRNSPRSHRRKTTMTLTTIMRIFRSPDRPTSHRTANLEKSPKLKVLSRPSSRGIIENPNLHHIFQSIRNSLLAVPLIRQSSIMLWRHIYSSKILFCRNRINGCIITCTITITTFHGWDIRSRPTHWRMEVVKWPTVATATIFQLNQMQCRRQHRRD